MKKHFKVLASLIRASLILLLIITLGAGMGAGLTQLLIFLSLLSRQSVQAYPLAFLPIMLQAVSTLLLIFVWVRCLEKRPLASLGLDRGRITITIFKGWAYALLINSLLIVSLLASGDLRLELVMSPSPLLGNLTFILLATHFQGAYEEIILRGWYFPALSRYYGRWLGLTMSSLVFGLLHVFAFQDILPLVNIILFGLLTCLLVWETGSLWLVIGLHSFNNFLLSSVFTLKAGFLGSAPFGLFIFDNPDKTLSHGILGSWQTSLLYSALIILMIGKRLVRTRSQKREWDKNR